MRDYRHVPGNSSREIGSFEAKKKLSGLLDQFENGAEIVITRHGKAVARLMPAEPGFDRKKAKRAADGLREAARESSSAASKSKTSLTKAARELRRR